MTVFYPATEVTGPIKAETCGKACSDGCGFPCGLAPGHSGDCSAENIRQGGTEFTAESVGGKRN